jgi:hypothetical protein
LGRLRGLEEDEPKRDRPLGIEPERCRGGINFRLKFTGTKNYDPSQSTIFNIAPALTTDARQRGHRLPNRIAVQ